MSKLFLFWKKDYNKGLTSVMGIFHKAISKAEKLMAKMEKEMDSNVEKINALQDRNAQIKKTHQETKNFANNLSKLLNA